MTTTEVTVRVPGKINLVLRSGPRRPDGYHSLATVFQAVSIYDDVTASPAAPGQFSVRTLGRYADATPLADDNIAVRAARLVASKAPDPSALGCHLTIRKDIPLTGGMAGGSADAAGSLLACATMWGLDVPLDELAVDLGADVPFCLHGGTALGSDRGDRLTPVPSQGTYHWVLALAEGGLSTPSVFERYDRLNPDGTSPLEVSPALFDALATGDPAALGRALVNDLQDSATDLRPDLRPVLDAAATLGALGAVLSGSGPTVAFLVADEAAAETFAAQLAAQRLAHAVRHVTGPVAGASVV